MTCSFSGGKKRSQCAVSEELCGDAVPDDIWPQFQKEALFGNNYAILVFFSLPPLPYHYSLCIFPLPSLIVFHSSCILSHPVCQKHAEMCDFENKTDFFMLTLLYISPGSVSPGDMLAVC